MRLYKVELSGRVSDSRMELELRGLLTAVGQEAMDDPDFKALVDSITLAVSKVMDESAYGGDGSEKLYRGEGCQTPAMQAHLKAVGAVDMEGDDETTMHDSEMPPSSSVHTSAAGVGQESQGGQAA